MHFSSRPNKSNIETSNKSSEIVQVRPHGTNPQIMLTDYDEKQKLKLSNMKTVHRTAGESALVDIEYNETATEKRNGSLSSRSSSPVDEHKSVESERNGSSDKDNVETSMAKGETTNGSIKRPVEKSHSLPVSGLRSAYSLENTNHKTVFSPFVEQQVSSSLEVPSSKSGSKDSHQKPNLMLGMAKTFHKWRTKTKKKKKFNFEKYIIYLESILPTVGFSVGGVVITWDGVSFFTVLLLTLVGIFAQEAFFGS